MEKTPIPAPLRSTTPNTYRSVPTRPADADLRPGEYVTPAEIEKLIKAARVGPLSTPYMLRHASNAGHDTRRIQDWRTSALCFGRAFASYASTNLAAPAAEPADRAPPFEGVAV
jgi:hypothetical protein